MSRRLEPSEFWKKLSTENKWALGDDLVLGRFDWREWFTVKPSNRFLNELDRDRMLWEMGGGNN